MECLRHSDLPRGEVNRLQGYLSLMSLKYSLKHPMDVTRHTIYSGYGIIKHNIQTKNTDKSLISW